MCTNLEQRLRSEIQCAQIIIFVRLLLIVIYDYHILFMYVTNMYLLITYSLFDNNNRREGGMDNKNNLIYSPFFSPTFIKVDTGFKRKIYVMIF